MGSIAKSVQILEADNWQVLYIDGVLIGGEHRWELQDVLALANVELESVYFNGNEFDNEGPYALSNYMNAPPQFWRDVRRPS